MNTIKLLRYFYRLVRSIRREHRSTWYDAFVYTFNHFELGWVEECDHLVFRFTSHIL